VFADVRRRQTVECHDLRDESKEFGTLFNLTAYTAIPGGLYLQGGGGGSTADAEGEALAILASFHEQG